jgi:hypothetical protein
MTLGAVVHRFCGDELTAVYIFVTTGATPILEQIIHVGTAIILQGALVTRHAGLSQMSPFKAEIRQAVIDQREKCRSKSLNVVADFAGSTIRATAELATVGILVAIGTLLVGYRLQRISRCMTLVAFHFYMKPAKRKIGTIVVDLSRFDLPPGSGIVAPGAILSKLVLVRILMAIGAQIELQTLVLCVRRIHGRRFVHRRVT